VTDKINPGDAEAALAALPGVLAQAYAWLAQDPDPVTRSEIEELIDADDLVTLEERFAAPLAFGTAGLRAPIGAGPARMNRLVVRHATAGLAAWLIEQGVGGGLVVVGHDARHGSLDFATDTAAVLVAAGFRVALCDQVVPTPLVAFATLQFGAVAGIMVTASHNPPQDNGYKVYLGDGAQIVSPADREIEVHIRKAAAASVDVAEMPNAAVSTWGDDLRAEYLAGVQRIDPGTSSNLLRSKLRIVYTAMHGVGAQTMLAAFALAGFTDVHPVPEQCDPDPDFPTVSFPNPEEPGALDLAIALAKKVGAHIVIANDPDADRMAAAVPDGLALSSWRGLRGDELGWLLADHLLTATSEKGPDRFVATTVVSSSLLRTIAEHHGVHYEETLTGFKYLARASMAHPEWTTVVMYEEAIGFCVGDLVRDKDGISAAIAIADLAAVVLGEGKASLTDQLAIVAGRYGASQTSQWSIRFDGADAQFKMADLMTSLRANPPSELDGVAIVEWRDLSTQNPPADVVVISVGDRGRVVVRPSGTEPKCKVYFEVLGENHQPSLDGMRASMQQVLGEA
jgi:phosphomannomutase